MLQYKSEIMSMSAAGGDKKGVPISFIPVRGPRLGRVVISKLRIRVLYSITTAGGQSITAAGQAAVLKVLRIWDAQGDLWRVTGPELRTKHIEEHGWQAVPDPALVGAGAGPLSRSFYFVCDLAPRYHARKRWDTAIPADVLYASGGIEIEMEAASALGAAPGLTLNGSPQYTVQVFAECREEFDLVAHARREVRSYASNNLTDLYLNVNGGKIRSAYAFKATDHITGGTDLSSTTDVTIEAFNLSSMPVDILSHERMLEGNHDWASTTDPFAQITRDGSGTPRIVSLVCPMSEAKQTDMWQHDGQILVRMNGNTVNNLPILLDLITRKTALSTTAEQQQGGVPATVKTASKTRKDLKGWGRDADYLPVKYHQPGRGK